MRGPMTVQQVIDVLARKNQDAEVRFDFCRCRPTRLESWRGVYDDLAIGWTHLGRAPLEKPPTVAALLAEFRGAIGKTYHGWKGGEYTMSGETLVHVDNPGEWTSTHLADIESDDIGDVVLITETQLSL